MHRSSRRGAFLGSFVVALVLAMGLAAGFGGSSARAKEMHSHPAHIHEGLCPTPGKVVYPLTDVSASLAIDGTPMAGESAGASSAIPVEGSMTTVKAALKDLLDGNHSIVVHESMANIANYIVCGDIGGTMVGTTDLAVGLGTLNDSGYSGVVVLHDNGDGSTSVTIFLTNSGAASSSGSVTPEATSASSAAAVAVDIKNFAFDPKALDVSSGTKVTWTNNDSTPHTVTADDGSFKSPVMNPGDKFTYTFDKAGSFAYHCEFHANMVATVTVK